MADLTSTASKSNIIEPPTGPNLNTVEGGVAMQICIGLSVSLSVRRQDKQSWSILAPPKTWSWNTWHMEEETTQLTDLWEDSQIGNFGPWTRWEEISTCVSCSQAESPELWCNENISHALHPKTPKWKGFLHKFTLITKVSRHVPFVVSWNTLRICSWVRLWKEACWPQKGHISASSLMGRFSGGSCCLAWKDSQRTGIVSEVVTFKYSTTL